MKLSITIGTLAFGAVSLAVLVLRPPIADRGDRGPEHEALEHQVHALRAEVGALETELARLRTRGQPDAPQPFRIADDDIDAAVARWMARNGAPEADPPSRRGPVAAPADPSAIEPLVRALLAPDLDEAGRDALWQRIVQAGELEPVLLALEAAAQKDGARPDEHVALADAYLQKLLRAPDGPERGDWATRADLEFDRALAADPDHWRARFAKAVALSFWPPVFGKEADAIAQFRTLIDQQEGRRAQPEFASAYLLLGNLYAQSGRLDEARAAWSRGEARFPDNEELRAKLAQQGG